MKVKSRPEDFRVEEIATVDCAGGPFALYRLTKTSIGTPEAVDAICDAWRLRREAVGVGGLKDRHAVTTQFLSVRNGPKRNLHQTSFDLEYLGQTTSPFDSKQIVANRFEIVLRDLSAADASRIVELLPMVVEHGVPNYFDDQRFGSVGKSGDFVARPWCSGDFERALWLAIAEANEHDRPHVREEKEQLRANWKNWPTCRRHSERPVVREIINRLCNQPDDPRGAFVRIPQHERHMYLGAFQSFLWNRILGRLLQNLFAPTDLVAIELARSSLPFYRAILPPPAKEQLERELPLPSARERLDPGPLKDLYESVAGEFGLECRNLRVKYPRDNFFSRGSRPAIFRPQALSSDTGTDELASGGSPPKRKLFLRFELPRGSYATILVKRITECA